jgi:hypothetical protein
MQIFLLTLHGLCDSLIVLDVDRGVKPVGHGLCRLVQEELLRRVKANTDIQCPVSWMISYNDAGREEQDGLPVRIREVALSPGGITHQV